MKSFALLLILLLTLNIQEKPPNPMSKVEFSGVVIDADSRETLPGVNIFIDELNIGTATDIDGKFSIQVEPGSYTVRFTFIGFNAVEQQFVIPESGSKNHEIQLTAAVSELEEVVLTGYGIQREQDALGYKVVDVQSPPIGTHSIQLRGIVTHFRPNTEEYEVITENGFQVVQSNPLSTFSIDVDGASYSNVRRIIMEGSLPPSDAVRIEEFINYFNYDYPKPTGNHPFSINTEVASAPWNQNHQLVKIGIKGEEIDRSEMLPNNLVFLLDVSGSMNSPDKLPLLKKGFRLLVNELGEEDYVSIVVYAGSSGLVLPPTSGFDKEKIFQAIDNLNAGGSTAGAAGIQLAYETAKKYYRSNANNRVILATDGDFNVGVSNDDALVELIEEKRNDGIFLSVLGFGSGNLKDSKMEKIANHGNGNYNYIDNLLEAKKVLVSEMGGTLHTIAKDVKIQIEFNPNQVQAYRLIGYENRLLEHHEFNDDTKDAGELGSGHTVTALYEVVPVGVEFDTNSLDVDPLKYQQVQPNPNADSNELMTVKFRYKHPSEDQSTLISEIIGLPGSDLEMSPDLSFSAALASFGMILRDSEHKGEATFELVKELAQRGIQNDHKGYRSEFLRIVDLAELIYQGNSNRE